MWLSSHQQNLNRSDTCPFLVLALKTLEPERTMTEDHRKPWVTDVQPPTSTGPWQALGLQARGPMYGRETPFCVWDIAWVLPQQQSGLLWMKTPSHFLLSRCMFIFKSVKHLCLIDHLRCLSFFLIRSQVRPLDSPAILTALFVSYKSLSLRPSVANPHSGSPSSPYPAVFSL